MAFVPGYPVYMQPIVNGATSKSLNIYITAASGLPLAGLAFDTADLLASYAGTKLARVAITLATQTVTGAWSSGGFVEKDAVNMPGWYRLDIPNAALALVSDEVVVTIVKDAVCQSSLIIPIPAATVGTVSDLVVTADAAVDTLQAHVGDPLSGTLAENVEAIGAELPAFDVTNTNTSRTDN